VSRDLARLWPLLDAAYSEPDPFDSLEALERAHHRDLDRLTLDEVDAERLLTRIRWGVIIYHGQVPSRWLLERIARLDQVAARLRQPAPR
jgi:hypothetical protein